MEKSAVVFLADGFEEIEALSPVDYLRRAGINVFTVAVPSKTMNDKYIVTSSHKVPVIADLSFDKFEEEFSNDLPDLIFCPGGMPGSSNLSDCSKLINFIKKCFLENKIISAICAAPAVVLAKTGCLKGKKWTCYPGMENNIASFCDLPIDEILKDSKHFDNKPFITDGNIVTGRGPGAAEEFAMELVRLMTDSKTATEISKGSCQR